MSLIEVKKELEEKKLKRTQVWIKTSENIMK